MMAPSDGSGSDESEDGSVMQATQTERQILAEITSKFGTLPRSTFVSDMCNEFSVKELSEFRRSLYDLAVDVLPDTPVGRLMVRKDTQNSGGKRASEKIADDIFVLYQYHEGDSTMDIARLLTERSRKEWYKNNAPTSLIPQAVSTHNNNDTETQQGMPLLEFCRELLVEMRKDRDIISENLAVVNRQLGSLPGLEKDIRELRSDISVMKERAIKAEIQMSHCVKSHSDINTKLNQVQLVDEQMVQFRRGVEHAITELRGIFASSTSRINSIDLTLSQSVSKIPKTRTASSCYPDRLSNGSNIITSPPRLTSVGPGLQPPRHAVQQSQLQSSHRSHQGTDPEQTYVKTVINSPQRHDAAIDRNNVTHDNDNSDNSTRKVQNSNNRDVQYKHSDTNQSSHVQASQDNITVTFGTDNQSTQRTTKYNPPDDTISSDTLRGFVPVNRPRNAPFFLSGILMKDDDIDNEEDTIKDIYDYIKRKGCVVKSIRKIKQSGIVLSVKMVGLQSDSDKYLSADFWPLGIRCRKWII
jgi:hypothetical protein